MTTATAPEHARDFAVNPDPFRTGFRSAVDVALEKTETPATAAPARPQRLTISDIMAAIEKQREAWGLVRENNEKIELASVEVADLVKKRAEIAEDDSSPLAKIGKSLTEIDGQSEIADGRFKRAKERYQESRNNAAALSRGSTCPAVVQGLDSLHDYRRDKIAHRIAEFLCDTATAETIEENAGFIRATAYDAARLDSSVVEINGLTAYRVNDDHVNLQQAFEETANYLLAHADEVDEALEWNEQRNARLATTPSLALNHLCSLIELPKKS